MEKCTFYKSDLQGEIRIPGSKSETHRYLISAALAEKETVIHGPLLCADTMRTVDFIVAMGGKVLFGYDKITVYPVKTSRDRCRIDCGESGSTARFIMPLLAMLRNESEILLGTSLATRPFEELICCMNANGASVTRKSGSSRIIIGGTLRGGEYVINKNISSQYASGLMFALPLAEEDSVIVFAERPESFDYIRLTAEILSVFGIKTEISDKEIKIPGRQSYESPSEVLIRSDRSFANLWHAASKICPNVIPTYAEGDEHAGQGNDLPEECAIEAIDSIFDSKDKIVEINADNCIDSVPVLTVCACAVRKKVRITGIKRLIYKESDRKASVTDMIDSLGGRIAAEEEALVIEGRGDLLSGEVNSANDHRIVMAAALASLICREQITVNGSEAVSKSYPRLIKDYILLGGRADVVNVRN